MWNKRYFDELNNKRAKSIEGGGAARIQKQHSLKKLTARERLSLLFDDGKYCEWNDFIETRMSNSEKTDAVCPGDGVVTAYGTINGRMAVAVSQDFTVSGGSLGEMHGQKICMAQKMAIKMRVPIIFMNDSGGARIEEGVDSLNSYAEIFRNNVTASGVIPQICMIMGPCAGGACYSPALCDFIFMVREEGMMFITGPQVVKSVIHEDISSEKLGGADVHMRVSGCAHFASDNDSECIADVRRLLTYLPQNASMSPSVEHEFSFRGSKKLEEVVVENPRKIYDIRNAISCIIDDGSFFEVQSEFALNAIIGFGRLEGRTIGIIGNQPAYMGGSLDYNAADKIARFVRTCDCFNIPLLTLVDVPAFLPGSQQEHSGIIRHGAKMLYAYAEATVPKITLILRKAYGGAYIAMCSKGIGADFVFSLPLAEIAVMGAEGAVEIVSRKEIKDAPDPDEKRKQLIAKYEQRFLNPYIAAKRGYVDKVIHPEESREAIINALMLCENKAESPVDKKHGNMSL